jgi:hypothetical protein
MSTTAQFMYSSRLPTMFCPAERDEGDEQLGMGTKGERNAGASTTRRERKPRGSEDVQVQAKVAFEALGRPEGMGILKERPIGQPPGEETRNQRREEDEQALRRSVPMTEAMTAATTTTTKCQRWSSNRKTERKARTKGLSLIVRDGKLAASSAMHGAAGELHGEIGSGDESGDRVELSIVRSGVVACRFEGGEG